MKIVWRFLLGMVAGILSAYGLLHFSDLSFAENYFLISIFGLMFILLMLSILRISQIRKLSRKQLCGDEEDEAEEQKYKLFSDFSIFANTSGFLAIAAVSMSIALSKGAIWIVLSIVLAVASHWLLSYMRKLLKELYPERRLPSPSDPNYAEKLLESADDGEKYVMLKGLYSSYNLVNTLLVLGIFLSAAYSVRGEGSQVFSIIVMSVILIAVNVRYLLIVKKKS